MQLTLSPRAEDLVAALARSLTEDGQDPLRPRVVLTAGPERTAWLQGALLDQLGVLGGVVFADPQAWLDARAQDALGAAAPLEWALDQALGELPDRGSARPPQDWQRARGPEGRLELALHLAQDLERWIEADPQGVRAAEARPEQGSWAEQLWAQLAPNLGSDHPLQRDQAMASAGWPVGAGPLPAAVHLYAPAPLAERTLRRLLALPDQVRCCLYLCTFVQPSLDLFPTPHPLVQASGDADLATLKRLLRLPRLARRAAPAPPAPTTVLAQLQADLAGALPTRARRVDGADRSLEFHAVHSPYREVQVLRDRLLAALDELPDCRPDDVLLLLAEPATRAGALQAVLERGEAPPLPLSGQWGVPDPSDPLRAALRWLELPVTRWEPTYLLDLLQDPRLLPALGLDTADLRWLEGLGEGVEGGLDASHWASWGLPAPAGATWADAWAEAPTAPLSRAMARVRAWHQLTLHRDWPQETLPPRSWAERLRAHLLPLLEAAAGPEATRPLAAALDRLPPEPSCRGWSYQELLDYLAHAATPSPPRRPEGGVRVARLDEAAGQSARIVAVLGLSDAEFPRQEVRRSFLSWPPGAYPTRREADRSAFLAALGAARDRLLLFWTGRSPRDGAPSPASVVVRELLDTLEEHFQPAQPGPTPWRTPREHPLHASAPRAFQAEPSPSSSRLFFEGARARSLPRAPRAPLFGRAVPAPDREVLSLADLTTFWNHPPRALLRRVLGPAPPAVEGDQGPPLVLPLDPPRRLVAGPRPAADAPPVGAAALLNRWIDHLFEQAAGVGGPSPWAPVEDPLTPLLQLVRLYLLGLRRPLPFTPELAYPLAEGLRRGAPPALLSQQARRALLDPWRGLLKQDADFALAFRGLDPLARPYPGLIDLAGLVFGPLLAAKRARG